jgi:hypothetical protein
MGVRVGADAVGLPVSQTPDGRRYGKQEEVQFRFAGGYLEQVE